MAKYVARIYDKSKNLLAVLENTTGAHFTRRIGQACEVGFGLPASDPKAALLAEAMYFDLFRDGVRIASARIEKRDMERNPYVVTGLTNEIKLRDLITPANWTYDGWEAMDAIRDLLLEFRTFVKQTKADWEDVNGERYRVDTTTQPTRAGDVVLAKDASGHYYASGYVVTAPIDLGPDVFKIDRIRWQQTVGEAVSIKVQTRTGNTPIPDGSWSPWSTEQGVAVPEESARTGVPCTSPTGRYIQVKLNLYTTDTQTPSETGTTFGFTPILHACEVVARYQTELSVGNVPVSISRQLQGVEFNYTNHLEAMGQICDKIKYEWEIDGDNRLNVAPQLGTDKSGQILLREGENTNITVLRDEPGEIVNVLTALGAGDGLAQLRITLQDDESIAKYGRRPGTYENRDLDDRDALLAEAQEYLAKMAWPQPELQVDTAVDPEWPEFRVGDIVRVVSPFKEINTTARILEERRQSTDRGELVTLGLNTTLQSLIDVIVGERPGLPSGEVVPSPVGLAISSGIKLLNLQWYGRADYFVIEHSTDGITFAILEPHWVGWSYTHSNLPVGSEHWYKVYAVRGGKRSAAAGPVHGVASVVGPGDMDQVPPATPTGLALTSDTVITTANVIVIRNTATWTANTEPDMKEYCLRRSEDNLNWQIIATVPFGATSYVDTQGLKDHTRYYYQIAAVDKTGNMSPWSASVYVDTTPDATPPSIPSNPPTILIGKKLLSVVLPGSDDLDLAVYKIQRREAPAEWDAANGVWKVPANPAWGAWADVPGGLVRAETWQDVNVEYSKCYSYRYCAIDTSMNPSQWSDPSPGAVPSQTGEQDLAVRSIHAQMYYEIRNVMPYNYLDSLDASKPFECDFYIPSETTGIVSIKLSARGLRYRAYSKTALLYEIIDSQTSSVGDHSHGIDSLMGTTLTTSAAGAVSAHTHSFEDTIPSSSTGSAGSHSHGVTYDIFAYTSYGGDPSHYHSYDRANGTGSAGSHSHSISTTTTNKTTGAGGAIDSHTHTVSVNIRSAGGHYHTINLSHGHGLEFGIYEDTTPAGVKLYCDNGAGYDAGQSLAAAPDTTTPYTLCTELNLTNKFTGTGWKRIKFTSTRLGRIAAVLIVKVDVSA